MTEPTTAELTEKIGRLSSAPVGQRDTPEEAAKRKTLRIQPNDFKPMLVNDPRTQASFKLSNRIASNLLVEGRLASPDLVERLRDKFDSIVSIRHVLLARFMGPLGLIIFQMPRYTVTINKKGELHISTVTRQYRDEPADPFPAVIEQIKEAVADVVLAEPRKAFMKEKTMTRVAQSVGLNDPLATKEITKFLGGRKSRKSKRTNKKTLKRHNGGRR
jgi:hypothetical protein